jgi:hypothetical protein
VLLSAHVTALYDVLCPRIFVLKELCQLHHTMQSTVRALPQYHSQCYMPSLLLLLLSSDWQAVQGQGTSWGAAGICCYHHSHCCCCCCHQIRGLSKAKAPHGELLASCDRVRDDTLPQLGVRLEDRPDGEQACCC